MLSSGSSYTQIDSGDATTAYQDNNVTAGQTYDYVVTAVNSEGQESSYSNMVQVTIPSP
jgi:fibronectin type 3 domain-containing protein